MVNVIVDTSSLLSFALIVGRYKGYGDEFDKPSTFDNALLNAPLYSSNWVGFENSLEAIVLYDNLLIDGASFKRSKAKIPELELFEEFCQVVEVSNLDEQRYYASIEAFYENIKGNKDTINLTSLDLSRPLMEEVQDIDKYMNRSVWEWQYIEEYLPDYLRNISISLRAILGEFTPDASASLLAILRTFYYQALQASLNTDLLLHPWKGHHYEGFYKTKAKIGVPSPASIVGMFESRVRDKHFERRETWLGKGVSFKYPILTHYILNKASSWNDLLKVCMDLRNSNKAKNFRKEINFLRDSIESGDSFAVDEILSSLENQAEIWSKKLNTPVGQTREVTISLRLVIANAGFKVNIPDKKIGKSSSGEKILIFMHELLQYSA
jgi:hypothetical protein